MIKFLKSKLNAEFKAKFVAAFQGWKCAVLHQPNYGWCTHDPVKPHAECRCQKCGHTYRITVK